MHRTSYQEIQCASHITRQQGKIKNEWAHNDIDKTRKRRRFRMDNKNEKKNRILIFFDECIIWLIEWENVENIIQYLYTFHQFLFQNICPIQVVLSSLLVLKDYFLLKIVRDEDKYLLPTKKKQQNQFSFLINKDQHTISKPFNELDFPNCFISLNIKSFISFFLHNSVISPVIFFSRAYFSNISASGTIIATV